MNRRSVQSDDLIEQKEAFFISLRHRLSNNAFLSLHSKTRIAIEVPCS